MLCEYTLLLQFVYVDIFLSFDSASSNIFWTPCTWRWGLRQQFPPPRPPCGIFWNKTFYHFFISLHWFYILICQAIYIYISIYVSFFFFDFGLDLTILHSSKRTCANKRAIFSEHPVPLNLSINYTFINIFIYIQRWEFLKNKK